RSITCSANCEMIPTRYKAKLPRDLSYPIGAEALTEGLANAPHSESFSVSFWDKQQPHKVLVAEYQHSRKPGYSGANFLVESGWYDEKWGLTVYPVARAVRHLANRLIRERGLPLLVQWLRSSERAGWLTRNQRIELQFNPAEETLSAEESSGV